MGIKIIPIIPIEREIANTIEGSASRYDAESNSHTRRSSSQENEFRGFIHENTFPRQDRFLESMDIFANEIKLRLSQDLNSMMSMMHSHIIRTVSSAIAESVNPEIQNMVRSLSSGNRDTESGLSSNNQEKSDGTTGFKSKVTKKYCRPAFDLRDTEDVSLYTCITGHIGIGKMHFLTVALVMMVFYTTLYVHKFNVHVYIM